MIAVLLSGLARARHRADGSRRQVEQFDLVIVCVRDEDPDAFGVGDAVWMLQSGRVARPFPVPELEKVAPRERHDLRLNDRRRDDDWRGGRLRLVLIMRRHLASGRNLDRVAFGVSRSQRIIAVTRLRRRGPRETDRADDVRLGIRDVERCAVGRET